MPFLTGYTKRKKITVAGDNVDATLTDFPLAVVVDADTDLGAAALANGHDLRFALADGTVLKYRRAAWSITGGSATGLLYVKVPSLVAAGTTIYLYYGDADAADGEDADAVWDSNFKGVWPLTETPSGAAGDFKDLTANGLHSENTANQPTHASGDFGGSAAMAAASSQHVQLPTGAAVGGEAFSLEGWFFIQTFATDAALIAHRREGWQICQHDTSGTLQVNLWHGGASDAWWPATAPLQTWFHLALTHDGTNAKTYLNGALVDTHSAAYSVDLAASANTYVGYDSYSGYLDGKARDFRISTAVRAAAWWKFLHANQTAADNEITWGAEQSSVGSQTGLFKADDTEVTTAEITGELRLWCERPSTGTAFFAEVYDPRDTRKILSGTAYVDRWTLADTAAWQACLVPMWTATLEDGTSTRVLVGQIPDEIVRQPWAARFLSGAAPEPDDVPFAWQDGQSQAEAVKLWPQSDTR